MRFHTPNELAIFFSFPGSDQGPWEQGDSWSTLDAERNIVSYDIERQCHAVFENVRLVLEDAGATWNDIVDVTVFLTNMKKDFAIFNRIYPEYFAGPGKPNPTRTTVEVGALPTPIAIELKVIAVCSQGC